MIALLAALACMVAVAVGLWRFLLVLREVRALRLCVESLEESMESVAMQAQAPREPRPRAVEIPGEYDLAAAWGMECALAGASVQKSEIERQRMMREEAGL